MLGLGNTLSGGIVPAVPDPWAEAFTFTINTENAGSATKTFVLPLASDGTIDIDVDWGDDSTSNIDAYDHAHVTHVYSATGTYTVKMKGTIRGWRFNYGGDRLKILNISQWGDMNITKNAAFRGCTNLTSNATDAPAISTLDLTQTFDSCSNLNGGTTGWNVGSVTSMDSLFRNCTVFNQNLSTWDTQSATNMFQMFQNANAFVGDGCDSWDVSKVTNMSYTFSCTNFTGNIGGWDTGEVTNMSNLFRSPSTFNRDIGEWDTSKVTNMGYMFYWNTTFNQDIGDWDTGAVTDMTNMLRYTTSFNQDISDWDIEDVTAFGSFMQGDTLSVENYDALLVAWAAQDAYDGLTVHFGSSTYSSGGGGVAAKANLVSEDGWTFTDGGEAG